MSITARHKNTAPVREARQSDWHRADIVAALHKRGWSLRRLSEARGYQPGTLSLALRKPWPKAERIIADAIGVRPEEIWPSRYTSKKA